MDAAAEQLRRALGQHVASREPLHLTERRDDLRRCVLPAKMLSAEE